MKQSAVCILIALVLSHISSAQVLDREPFSIGESFELQSSILNENRRINVYLPNTYNMDTLKSYPVIYLLDGSADEDFIHVCGLVQFCSFSWIEMIEESIVVGIANVDRKRDFTYPSKAELDKKELPTSGGSKAFIDFLEKELQDEISSNYRVTNEKTIIGQSLGGLLATEILYTRPSLFDNYIIISPSLWWDDEKLLQTPIDKSLKAKSIYVGVGKEGPLMERVARSLHENLMNYKTDEINLHFGYFEQLSHGDTLHLAVYDAFEKLFSKTD